KTLSSSARASLVAAREPGKDLAVNTSASLRCIDRTCISARYHFVDNFRCQQTINRQNRLGQFSETREQRIDFSAGRRRSNRHFEKRCARGFRVGLLELLH